MLRRNQRDITINGSASSCKISVILVRLELNLTFLYRFSNNTQISNFMKIRPLGAELFHAEGRTDRHDEINSRPSKFVIAPKKREVIGQLHVQAALAPEE